VFLNPLDACLVEQKDMIELVQQFEVLSISLNRTSPELVYEDHGLGTPLAPIPDTGEFDKSLGAPNPVDKKFVVFVQIDRHDCRSVPQPQSLANTAYESVEVALDTKLIMWR
jgi:hypothetical protein